MEKDPSEVQTLHTARQLGRPKGPCSAPHGDSAPKIIRLKTFDSMRKHVFLSKYYQEINILKYMRSRNLKGELYRLHEVHDKVSVMLRTNC